MVAIKDGVHPLLVSVAAFALLCVTVPSSHTGTQGLMQSRPEGGTKEEVIKAL